MLVKHTIGVIVAMVFSAENTILILQKLYIYFLTNLAQKYHEQIC